MNKLQQLKSELEIIYFKFAYTQNKKYINKIKKLKYRISQICSK